MKIPSKMPGKLAAAISAALLLVSTGSFADTLDFNTFSLGAQSNAVMVLPQATITSFGTDIYVGATGIDHEICALRGYTCDADMNIAFTSTVNNLSFETFGWHTGDRIDVNVYSGATLLGTVGHSTNGLVDLTGFMNVTRIFLDDSSTGAGMSYDHFNFTTAIPEPEVYAMLGLGLGLMGWAGRRRRLRPV